MGDASCVLQSMSDTANPVAKSIPLKKARLATEQLVLALNEQARSPSVIASVQSRAFAFCCAGLEPLQCSIFLHAADREAARERLFPEWAAGGCAEGLPTCQVDPGYSGGHGAGG